MSDVTVHGSSPQQTRGVKAADDQRKLAEIFSELVSQSVDDFDPRLADSMLWMKQVCEYNVPLKHFSGGMMVVQSYRLVAGDKCTEESIRLAMIVGCCVEWYVAFFNVTDDVMDNSVTRGGQPCWYQKKDVGLIAVNDALFLEATIYHLLKKYFRHQPYYMELVDLFHQATRQTVIGQNFDMLTSPADRCNFALYTMERYNALHFSKTTYFAFYLPISCALCLGGISVEESLGSAMPIVQKLAEFWQIENDYQDCYGDPAVNGKVGTDIQENKCTWLIVQALIRANDEQRPVLEANYGRQDEAAVRKVKEIYDALKLRDLYADYEQRSYDSLMELIDQFSGQLPREMFIAIAQKLYKRQK